MELREYWAILARRSRLIALITAIAFAASVLMIALGPTYYRGELTVVISLKPEPRQGNYYMYDSYYTWLTSEYLVDDFGEVLKSDAFAKDVAQRINQEVPASVIKRQLETKKTHRLLTVTVTTPSFKQSLEISNAIRDAMEQHAADYFVELSTQNAALRVIDGPNVAREMGVLRSILEVVLRTLAGLLAGVSLAFLLHYLDPTVRDRTEAERLLGLPVLGELP